MGAALGGKPRHAVPAYEKEEEARQLLSNVYGRFKEGFETRDLLAAKKLLAELS